MSGPGLCAQIRPELGVYVLGAIAPADRARVSWHLASCPRCREEVVGLAGLPALLRTVPTATVLELSGERPPDLSGPPGPHPARHPLPDLGHHCQRQHAVGGGWTVTRSDPARVVPRFRVVPGSPRPRPAGKAASAAYRARLLALRPSRR